MTFRFRSNFKGIGLYRILGMEGNKVILENVTRGDRKWYGIYIEDRPYRKDYETMYINARGDRQYALDIEYLPDTFDMDGVRPMFLGEHGILKLYNAICPYHEREMLDRDKFLGGDFSQLTKYFDNNVCVIFSKGRPIGFMTQHQYLNLIENRPLEKHLVMYLQDLGIDPPQDFVIK